jgi:SAM-dependent methyltransferase
MSHWNDYISYVSRIKEIKGSRILEVGSNDGYLLSRVRQFSQNILGVDASPYMGSIASQSGVPTIVGTFGESQDLKSSISDYYSEYDFIFANNVLNHSNNPLKFINLISDLLAKDGCFVFEVPYWLETILSLHFDQIYHEHITYWTVKSSEFLLASAGLFIQDVNLVDYHGGSLRIVASKNPNKKSKKIESFIDRENRALLLEVETYINYVREIDLKKKVFLDHLMQYKQQGKLVFGVGAAAKANTLLTYYGISAEDMKFILDSSPHKQGKITPVSMIPIVGDSHVVEIRNGIGVVLAWNLSNKLKDYLLTLNSELEFLEL